MRLKLIWTIPSMSTMERLRRTREWATMELARRLPRRLRYWVTMMEIAKATRTSSDIPATPLDDILMNLQKDYEK